MLARVALPLLIVALVGACAPPAADPTPATPTPAPAGPLPFDVLVTGQVARYDRTEPMLAVLTDASSFGRWWSDAIGQRDPAVVGQAVAFGQEIVVGVLHGRRSTGGYAIEVTEVRQQGNSLIVIVATHAPPPAALVPQVITSPHQVIKINVSRLPNWRQLHYLMRTADGTVLAETAI